VAAVIEHQAVPLVIAVVGHRDPRPEALPRLRELFRQDLELLLRALPHTPLLMLNGLASGMDSEAAEVFLEVCAGGEHRLVAALPKQPEHYRADFSAGPELERLERLLQASAAVLHPGNCAELRGDAEEGEDLPSPQCYGQQGLVLVRHAYLLFAFNNGVETMEVGGTSQSVAVQKGEVHPLFLSVEEVIASLEPGALIDYDTPRFKNRLPEGLSRPERSCWLQGQQTRAIDDLLTIPSQLERANRSGLRPTRQLRRQRRAWLAVALVVSVPLALLDLGWATLVPALIAALSIPWLTRAVQREAVVQHCLADAEAVQAIWALAGVETDCADLLQSRMHPALHWVRTHLRADRLQRLCSGGPSEAWEQAHRWLVEQQAWQEQRYQRLRRNGRQLLRLNLVAGLASVLLGAAGFPRLSWIGLVLGLLVLLEAVWCADRSEARRSRRRRDQLGRCLRAYEQALYTAEDEPHRLKRLRCALEAAGRDTLDELNDRVSAHLR
jgi:Flp pilus assembly protein TadB